MGTTIHIEQRLSPSGPQAYICGTRVVFRHVAAFLQGGYSVEEIVQDGLPHLPPAAIYEAVAYYFDHKEEINIELAENSEDNVYAHLREGLSDTQFAQLTGRTA